MREIIKKLRHYLQEISDMLRSKPWLIIITIFYFFVVLTLYRYLKEAYTLQSVDFFFGEYKNIKTILLGIVILHFGIFFLIKQKIDYKINLLAFILALSLGLPNAVLALVSILFSSISSYKVNYYFLSTALLMLTLFDVFTRIEKGLTEPTLAISAVLLCLISPYLAKTS